MTQLDAWQIILAIVCSHAQPCFALDGKVLGGDQGRLHAVVDWLL